LGFRQKGWDEKAIDPEFKNPQQEQWFVWDKTGGGTISCRG
jgi:hypothetical protein